MIRPARRIVLPISALALALVAAGCGLSRPAESWMYPHAMRTTLAEGPEDHAYRVSRIVAHDRLSIIEDLDLLFLTDRQGRLTRWHDR